MQSNECKLCCFNGDVNFRTDKQSECCNIIGDQHPSVLFSRVLVSEIIEHEMKMRPVRLSQFLSSLLKCKMFAACEVEVANMTQSAIGVITV